MSDDNTNIETETVKLGTLEEEDTFKHGDRFYEVTGEEADPEYLGGRIIYARRLATGRVKQLADFFDVEVVDIDEDQ